MEEARALTDDLFGIVRTEALYERPIPERHRIIFYIGHLEAFDWNLIGGALKLPSSRPAFDRLFAFGIDPVDGKLPSDQPGDWPPLSEVRRYVAGVRETLDASLRDPAGLAWNVPRLADGQLLHVAVEHRLMHAETLAYMFHRLPCAQKVPRATQAVPATRGMSQHKIEIPAGRATLGRRRGDGFGWDNEFDEFAVDVPAFRMDACNVTNGEFLEFLDAGGYRNRRLWSDAAWEWKDAARIEHPAFWARRGSEWFYRGMFAEFPLPLDWPVYVSYAEATAYARWKGGALPTEAQFHRAAFGTPDGSEREYPWGAEAPGPQHGNFDFQHWDPVPVGSYPAGRSAFSVADLLGNGWEWTSTVFAPFAGFEPFPFYPGYSADFFDGRHYVMKGGSPRTAACLLRRSFRNWFQGHYPYVYATLRCVE
jgi:ergothioneine biosynthesis protein EgtB